MAAAQDTPSTDSSPERAEYVAGLRAMANFIEAHPELPLPYGAALGRHYLEPERDDFIAAVRTLGGASKQYLGGTMRVVRRFGPHEIAVQIDRDAVCERVVVGTEKVLVPDPDAPMVTVERDKIEWRCSPLLGREEATAA